MSYNPKEHYINGILDWRKKCDAYVEKFDVKIPPKQAHCIKVMRDFYEANLGFSPEEASKAAGTALVHVQRREGTVNIDTLREVWKKAVGIDPAKGCSAYPKSVFTIFNPKGKPFRVKARISLGIKATPVGAFIFATDVVINNRAYVSECWINLKHVRWIKHPFLGISQVKKEQMKAFRLDSTGT
jgi:hypothetical protein